MRAEYNTPSPVEVGEEAPDPSGGEVNLPPGAGPSVSIVCDCGQHVRDFQHDPMPGLLPATWHALEKGGRSRRVNVSPERVDGRQQFDLKCRRCRDHVPARGEKMLAVLDRWVAVGGREMTMKALRKALTVAGRS